jgi:hypothetical protein
VTRARIDHTVTASTFSLDGRTFKNGNNVWVVGGDSECVGIDAPAIVELLGLPEHTVVWTGHGDDTTIKAEKAEVPRPVRDA